MPIIDIQNYKVIYNNRVLKALQVEIVFSDDQRIPMIGTRSDIKPKFLIVTYINEDCNIAVAQDEAWCFQFIPIKDGCVS